MPNDLRSELEELRLPDLVQRYREVLGEQTRCPNRTYLIRRITEALAARPTEAQPSSSEGDPAPPDELAAATPATVEPTTPSQAHTPVTASVASEPMTARRSRRSAARVERPGARTERGRFKSLTVEELQTSYLSIVGRSTGSTDRGYLIWKIREAEKGRVPIGPREKRLPGQQAQIDARILPLRLDAKVVAALDATWRSHGLKSRMELFRRALGHYLAHIGAHGAASLFGAPGPQ